MNRERARELLPVMQAFADGAEIQFRSRVEKSKWSDSTYPNWDAGFKYRIKPKPQEFWMAHCGDEKNRRNVQPIEDGRDFACFESSDLWIKVRKVIE